MRPSFGLAPSWFVRRGSVHPGGLFLAGRFLAGRFLAGRFLAAPVLAAIGLLACGAGEHRASSAAHSRSTAGAPSPALPGTGAAGAGMDGAPRSLAAGSDEGGAGQRHLSVLGIQLYTLRAPMQQDFEGTLRSVAGMGYRELEFAGLFGHDPAQVKRLLDTLGLTAVGSHVDWQRIRDDAPGAIAETLALGAHYLVFPYLPAAERRTLAQWQNWVLVLNRLGQACKERGLELAYHNHDFEFTSVEGVVPYDLLLEQLDHRLVQMEIDLYWVAKAGRDPIALFEAHPGIFPLGHVKDMRRSDQAIVEVGQGDLDFAAVFARSDLSGMQHFIVEHDNPADPLQTARNSQRYLEQLSF